VSQMAIVIVISVYWSMDESHFERLWLSVVSGKNRTRVRDIWRGIEGGVGAYIRSEIGQSFLAAILLGVSYSIIGLPYPALLAVLGALMWLIPWLGAVLAMALPVIFGFAAGPVQGIIAGLVTLVILLALEIIVEPILFNRRRYNSLLVVLMLIALADAMGLIGVLVAPPLAAAVQIFFSNVLSQPEARPFPASKEKITTIKERLVALHERAEDMDVESPYVNSMLDRLDKLVAKAEDVLEQPQASMDEFSI
ncbi:MAG: AI-2E family transporter, partial [Chloroflexi bacterium]